MFPSLSFLKKADAEKILQKEGSQQVLRWIFQQRPQMEKLLEEYGQLSLAEYSYLNCTKRIVAPDSDRQAEFIGTFQKIVEERLGKEIALEVSRQLQSYYFVSTGDHHGPIGPVFGLHSNMVIGAGYRKVADPLLKYILVLSCASVSLNHQDFPRGLLFHTSQGDLFETQKLSFLPSNSHSCVVYRFRSYVQAEVEKVRKNLQEKVREQLVSSHDAEKIQKLLDSVYLRPEILESENYTEQITKSNRYLWREYFPKDVFSPELLYIEQEEVVVQLLLENHLDQNTVLHRMIFEPDGLNIIEKLQNAMNPFLRQGMHGTDLFWGVSKKHYRCSLRRVGRELVSDDGSLRFLLDPESIRKALEDGLLIPNLLLIFTVLVLYYQVNCFGGFNQMHYLIAMQQVYNQEGFDTKCSKANTELFSFGLQLLFLSTKSQRIPALGMDLFLHKLSLDGQPVEEKLSSLSLLEAFLPELLENDHEIAEK